MTTRVSYLIAAVALLTVSCECYDTTSFVEVGMVATGSEPRTLRVGDTAIVWARAIPDGHPDRVCDELYTSRFLGYHDRVQPDSFTFRSSNPAVAVITNAGVLTALQPGRTNITAVSSGIVSDPFPVTIGAAPASTRVAVPN